MPVWHRKGTSHRGRGTRKALWTLSNPQDAETVQGGRFQAAVSVCTELERAAHRQRRLATTQPPPKPRARPGSQRRPAHGGAPRTSLPREPPAHSGAAPAPAPAGDTGRGRGHGGRLGPARRPPVSAARPGPPAAAPAPLPARAAAPSS